jgi:hypothetical protein
MKKIPLIIALIFCICSTLPLLNGGTLSIYQNQVSLFDGPTQLTSGTFAVYLGSFDGISFSPFLGSSFTANNSGFITLDPDFELEAVLTQNDNLNLSAGSPIYIAVSLQAFGSDYDALSNQAVLSDPAWLIPVFDITSSATISISNNTTAVVGGFDFNSGSPQITAVPEPSSAALLLVGSAAFLWLRKRRVS